MPYSVIAFRKYHLWPGSLPTYLSFDFYIKIQIWCARSFRTSVSNCFHFRLYDKSCSTIHKCFEETHLKKGPEIPDSLFNEHHTQRDLGFNTRDDLWLMKWQYVTKGGFLGRYIIHLSLYKRHSSSSIWKTSLDHTPLETFLHIALLQYITEFLILR